MSVIVKGKNADKPFTEPFSSSDFAVYRTWMALTSCLTRFVVR